MYFGFYHISIKIRCLYFVFREKKMISKLAQKVTDVSALLVELNLNTLSSTF